VLRREGVEGGGEEKDRRGGKEKERKNRGV
jgi:hypothetical protein